MKCSSTVEVLDTPFVYSFFFTVKFQVAAKGDDSILASKKDSITQHHTTPPKLRLPDTAVSMCYLATRTTVSHTTQHLLPYYYMAA